MIVLYMAGLHTSANTWCLVFSYDASCTHYIALEPNECILLAPPTVGPRMWDTE